MGDLCAITSGKSNAQDAVEDGPYIFFDRSKTPKRSSRYLYDRDALIIPGEGTEFIPRHFVGKFDLHQRAYALFDFDSSIEVRYLYYYLIYFKAWFVREAVGATVKSLRRRHFTELPVVVAPVVEQKRIVAILDEAFAGIDAAITNTETNLANARDLFGGYLNSILVHWGEDWEKRPLGKLCDVLDKFRKPITRKDRIPGPYPYYGATGIVDWVKGYLFDERLVLVGEDGAKWGPGDNSAFIVDGKVWVNNHAHVLRPNREVLLDEWLVYQLNAADLAPFITGLTVPKLNQGRLREIPLAVPPLDEQRRMVATLNAVRDRSAKYGDVAHQKLAALAELKQSILQKAFTGELTAKEAERQMAVA
jgi:type I restriction enzyme, S subunit